MKTKTYKPLKYIAAVCAALLVLSVIVYAASPALRNYINMLFLVEDSVSRIEEVPEGYIGVYTPEDLNNVRVDLVGRYVMMNDIEITPEYYAPGGLFEGGFKPIGTMRRPFRGIFNGNGYVISGLVVDGNYSYTGLFGNCVRMHSFDIVYDDTFGITAEYENRMITGGIIKNLGLVNGSVTLDMTKPYQLEYYLDGENNAVYYNMSSNDAKRYVGGIAGWADYLVGCYTENFNVNAIVDGTITKLSEGGAVGGSYFVDSCYSFAAVSAAGEAAPEAEVYISGLSGYSFSCVTSYFGGTINGGAYADSGVTYIREYDVPMVMSDGLLLETMKRLDEYQFPGFADELAKCGEPTTASEYFQLSKTVFGSDFVQLNYPDVTTPYSLKLNSFYCSREYIAIDIPYQDYLTAETDTVQFHLLDPETREREYNALSQFLGYAFPDNTFREYCRANQLKGGYYCNYDLRYEPDCTFEGFDFDNIWNDPSSPKLRLFSGAGADMSGELPDIAETGETYETEAQSVYEEPVFIEETAEITGETTEFTEESTEFTEETTATE